MVRPEQAATFADFLAATKIEAKMLVGDLAKLAAAAFGLIFSCATSQILD